MWKGRIVSILIATEAKISMESRDEARAVPGRGLEGDRYFFSRGAYSQHPGGGRALTLVESEAIAAAAAKLVKPFTAADARRNLVTQGVPLNHLVGRDFRVGEVTLRGVRLCEPCGYLEELTQPGVSQALLHRGGLRVEILTEGKICVGDSVEPLDSLEDQNKNLIRRYYQEMWNPWNFDLANEILSDEILFYGSLGVASQGRAAFCNYMRVVRAAFPDFHNQIEELVAEGDQVVARLTYCGTHHGDIFGIAPTGKKIRYAGAAIFKIANGKIFDGWVLGDRLALALQLGATFESPALAENLQK
ncbi:MAG: ester cyclase [Candidatus Acidiferrales bacterium]